jgi:uncharacterized protein (DUF433 family)
MWLSRAAERPERRRTRPAGPARHQVRRQSPRGLRGNGTPRTPRHPCAVRGVVRPRGDRNSTAQCNTWLASPDQVGQSSFLPRSSWPASTAPYAYPMVKSYFDRITVDPGRLGGRPGIRDLRISVGMVVQMVAVGKAVEEITSEYPYLEAEDVHQALAYCAALAEMSIIWSFASPREVCGSRKPPNPLSCSCANSCRCRLPSKADCSRRTLANSANHWRMAQSWSSRERVSACGRSRSTRVNRRVDQSFAEPSCC